MGAVKRSRVLYEYEAGVSVHELAQDYNVTPATVRNWLSDARRERAFQREYVEMLEAQQCR